MVIKFESTNLMPERFFVSEIEKMTGIAVSDCYQCFRCTNGCPAARDMDIVPHRIIGYIISGERRARAVIDIALGMPAMCHMQYPMPERYRYCADLHGVKTNVSQIRSGRPNGYSRI